MGLFGINKIRSICAKTYFFGNRRDFHFAGSNTLYSRFLIILFLQFFAILNFNFCDFCVFCDFYKKYFFCYHGHDFGHTLVKGSVLRHTRGAGVCYSLQNTRCCLHTGLIHDTKRISNDIF